MTRDVELTVPERLWLLQLLPREGDIATLRQLRALRAAIAFDDEEAGRLDVRVEGTLTRWDTTKETAKVLPFTDMMAKLVEGTLEKLSKEKKLNLDCVTLYEKFCE